MSNCTGRGVELRVADTTRAVAQYNALALFRQLVAALHVTCWVDSGHRALV